MVYLRFRIASAGKTFTGLHLYLVATLLGVGVYLTPLNKHSRTSAPLIFFPRDAKGKHCIFVVSFFFPFISSRGECSANLLDYLSGGSPKLLFFVPSSVWRQHYRGSTTSFSIAARITIGKGAGKDAALACERDGRSLRLLPWQGTCMAP